jgi:DNA-3-methyladenine glycosylase II
MRTIDTDEHLAEGLAHLVRADRRLAKVVAIAGTVGLRRREAGFAGLARIIVGQQLSVASASAIWERFATLFPEMTPEAVHRAREPRFRRAGMSAAKTRALRAIAAACRDGLDLAALAAAPAEEAHARLCAVHGIGPWTADLYLLFCLGHPDIFPVGDLALRNAVADAYGLETADPKAIGKIAESWKPWRGAAANLFWAYYAARRKQKWAPL